MDVFHGLWPQAEMTRRKLLAAGAASGFVAGFALSAQPVMAQTMIVTDTAGLEAGIPVSTVEQMKQALGAGSPSTFQVYPDAPHAFFADYRPSYREAAAKDGWERLTAWFKTNIP